MTNGLVYDDKYHRYFLDDVRVPSTTGICGVINKPGLLKWYGDNGTVEAKRISREAAEFGTRVHKGCESIAKGRFYLGYPPEEVQCIESYAAWFFKHVSNVVLVEQPVASRVHQMAGTPDIAAVLKGVIEVRRPGGKLELVDMDGETGVLDLKTSSMVDAGFALQLEAYRRMVGEWLGVNATRRLVIHLPRKTPGKIEVVEFPMEDALDDWRTFLSASIIWHRLFKAEAFAPRKPFMKPATARP